MLIKVLDLLPLELHGGRHQTRVRIPDVVDQANGAGNFKFLKPEFQPVIGELAKGSSGNVTVLEKRK